MKVTNKQKYSVLNTLETDSEVWWNALDRWGHVEVGNIAIQLNLTTDIEWICNVPYAELSNKQKNTLDCILKQKDVLK